MADQVVGEFDLGLPEKPEKRPASHDGTRETPSWSKYTAKNPRFCDVCMAFQVDPQTGVPRNALAHATHTEDGPEGRLWLCSQHTQERRALWDAKTSDARAKKRSNKIKRR